MAGKGRPKGPRDVAPKVRFIVDNAMEKLGMQVCIDMLAEEMVQDKECPDSSLYFPKK